MRKTSFLTKLKIKWLTKRKLKLRQKVDDAFIKVRQELIDFISDNSQEPNYFITYLAQCVATNDVYSFISILTGIAKDARKCKGDSIAEMAERICSYAVLRIHYLSHFTLLWTMLTIYCPKCKTRNRVNFLYTDKICKCCGNIIL